MTTDIEVFTTPTCPYCTKIKQWLDEEGYEYEEHDVADDKEAAKRMIETNWWAVGNTDTLDCLSPRTRIFGSQRVSHRTMHTACFHSGLGEPTDT